MILKRGQSAIAVLVCGLASIAWDTSATQPVTMQKQEKELMTQTKFYCNTKALNPSERAHHKLLTYKLVANRTRIVETEKGYEFQYSPSTITLVELADWVASESKCCPFFGFHIDLEDEGKLLCLRLTGEEGVKAFLRSEFLLPAKS
jgi:hypothetical protein